MQFISKTIFAILFAGSSFLNAAQEEAPPRNPKEALTRLMEGNERFTKDQLQHPNNSQTRREALTDTQNPFATIVGCSDSRVPLSLVFDQGIGDMFVVRVAGNVVGPIEIASVEYSTKVLGSSLVFVLGHENCGAVKAVLSGQAEDIKPISERIKEALVGKNKSEITLEYAIKANVRNAVNQIRSHESIAKLIKDKKVEVVGGYYRLESGKVELCCDIEK